MTFMVSVSIKPKIQTCPQRHWRENEKKEKENLPVNPNTIQKAKIQKHIHEDYKHEKFKKIKLY